MTFQNQPQQPMPSSIERPAEEPISEPMPTCCCCCNNQTALIIWLILVFIGNLISIVMSINGHQNLGFIIAPVVGMVWTVFGICAIHSLNVTWMKIYFWVNMVLLIVGTAFQLFFINLPFFSGDICDRIRSKDSTKTINCDEVVQATKTSVYIITAINILIQAWILYKVLELLRWARSRK